MMKAMAVATTILLVMIRGAPGIAAEQGRPGTGSTIPIALAGTAVSDVELARGRARGILLNGAASNGLVGGNSIGARSVTGVITNTNSVNNNTGLTTVFQNTGNNSLFQSSTSIYITVH